MPKLYARSDLVHVTTTITFDGTAGAGAVGTVTAFTISGRVLLEHLTVFCTDSLVANATPTIIFGVTGNTSLFIGSTDSRDLDTNKWWQRTGAAQAGGEADILAVSSNTGGAALSANMIFTLGGQAVTAGTVVVDAWYRPITAGASLS